jgi:hypothetical protein
VEPGADFNVVLQFPLVIPSNFSYAALHNQQIVENGMWKAALAGAMLATMGATFCQAQDNGSFDYAQPARQGPTITAGHIARLKAALKLTPEQQRHWPAVASALHNLSRKTANSAQGLRQRASAAVGSAAAVRRVAAAARPLIASLTDQQRQAGMQVIRASGFASLASAM